MQVTNVQLKLHRARGDKLRAYATITFDGAFVIRDIRLVEGPEGLFIAMPSRKLTAACPSCGHKNALQAAFCNECGGKLVPRVSDAENRIKLHSDLAHPLNGETRGMLQEAIVRAYNDAVNRGVPVGREESTSGDAGPEEFDSVH